MTRKKAYAARPVNRLVPEEFTKGRQGLSLDVGVDVGKFEILVAPRWSDGDFGRPWRVDNPGQVPLLVRLLAQLGQTRSLRVALEPSGTYGDALRQALHDAAVPVYRVSPKAAHDYAEVFDGVPS
jgi:transposase